MRTTEFVDIDGVKLWTSKSYSGNTDPENQIPVLMISGGPGFEDYLNPISQMIEDLTTIYRFEPRGCGRSDNKPAYDFQTVINDIENIRKHFEVSKWIVIGHSWGATIALAYGLFHPTKIHSVIYMAGIGVQHNLDWYAEFRYNKKNKPDPLPDMVYPFNDEVNHIGNQSWWDYIQDPKIWHEISKLAIPILIIQAEKDVRPNWPAKQLSHLLPNAVYKEIKEAVHCIWFTHTDELKNELRTFIQKH